MDGLCIPPNPISIIRSTPEDGLIYIAGSSKAVAHISPPLSSQSKSTPLPVKIIPFTTTILAIDCDPNWTRYDKHFAVMEDNLSVNIWNLYNLQKIFGHKGHTVNDSNKNAVVAMCFTKNKTVLSTVGEIGIKFCLKSNTYFKYSLNSKWAICVLNISPYDDNIVAAGTKTGQIILLDTNDFSLLCTLRGHKTEIISIEWIAFKSAVNEPTNETISNLPNYDLNVKSTRIQNAEKNIEAEQILLNENILSESNSIKNNLNLEAKSADEIIVDSSNSEYLIEQTLIDNISSASNSTNNLNLNVKSNNSVKSESLNSSGIHCETLQNNQTDQTLKENDYENDESHVNDNNVDEIWPNIDVSDMKICIASSSLKDSNIWLWDTKTGVCMKKMEMKNYDFKGKEKMFYKNNTCFRISWIDNSMLAVLSLFDCQFAIFKVSWIGDNRFSIIQEKIICEIKLDIGIIQNRLRRNILKSPIWTFTHKKDRKLVFGDINSNYFNIQGIYTTMSLTQRVIHECPHDPNKIVVGGNGIKFNIINITKFTKNYYEMTSFVKDDFLQILSIAWHPTNKNLLAYSTTEGSICIIDISSNDNQSFYLPTKCNEFCQISWAQIETEDRKQQCALFVCQNGKLLYYPENKNYRKYSFVETYDVNTVSSGKDYIAIGMNTGGLTLFSLQLKYMWYKKITTQCISNCAWSSIVPNRLAISSFGGDIYLFTTCTNDASKDIVHDDGKLIGHKKGVNMIKWSQHNENYLLSCGMDCTVRVWDTKKFECIALVTYSNRVHCAMFSPNDGNLVLVTGNSETIHCFDIRNFFGKKFEMNRYLIYKTATNFKWATEDFSTKNVNKKKIQTIVDNGEIASKTTEENIKVTEISAGNFNSNKMESASAPSQLTYSTILPLTNKDFNKNALQCLQSIIKPYTGDKLALHSHLYSTHENIKKLLEIELQNHKDSNTLSIAHILIPQMCGNLQMDILKNIDSKSISELHISMASSISYEFWKKCCKAYASQCIEKNMTLQAMPYLLGCHKYNESIDALCAGHFYLEAWIIAKLYKDIDDVTSYNSITTQWITYLESQGNLDGAALVAASVEDYGTAIRMLSKRNNGSEETKAILEWMKSLVQ